MGKGRRGVLAVKLCDPHLSALEVRFSRRGALPLLLLLLLLLLSSSSSFYVSIYLSIYLFPVTVYLQLRSVDVSNKRMNE